MEQLGNGFVGNHPNVARRIVGTMVLDAQHLTEDQLLARPEILREPRGGKQHK